MPNWTHMQQSCSRTFDYSSPNSPQNARRARFGSCGCPIWVSMSLVWRPWVEPTMMIVGHKSAWFQSHTLMQSSHPLMIHRTPHQSHMLEYLSAERNSTWTVLGRSKTGAIAGVDVEFVRTVFDQCRMGDDDVEWDLLTLAFEAAVDVKRYVCSDHQPISTHRIYS